MNSFRNYAYSILLLFAVLLAGCESDRNPLDYFNLDGKKSADAKAYIQLTLNAADTRAVDESAISLVNLYIFDEDGNLEKIVNVEDYSDGKVIALDVVAGTKAIYAITANELFGSKISDGFTTMVTTLSEFESIVFESTLSSLITDDGFVMAGKQTGVSIITSNSEEYVPDSNKLSITLQRLVAKVTVDASSLEAKTTGFTIGTDIGFKVFQTNDEMILNQSGYIKSSFENISSTDGTYDTYTFDNASVEYSSASSSASSSSEYQYVPENRVENPVTGNTTFVSVKVPIVPNKVKYYSGSLFDTSYTAGKDFYAVGIISTSDPSTIKDFCKDYNGNIYLYDATAISTLDSYTSGLFSPGTGLKYVLLKYEGGCAYYRVNIKDNAKYKVCRNTCYSISLQSLSGLGAPSEEYLRPSNAATELSSGEQLTYTSTSATLTVGGWTDKSDSVDL